MGSALGDILPLAVGVAISPIPVIAAVLMLLAPKAKAASVAFLLGWVVGIVVVVAVFTLVSGLLPEQDPTAARPVSGAIKCLLGALLLVLAAREWRGRPREGAQPELPPWMAAIDSITPARGAGLGFLLSAVNPKNLLMGIGAGLAIGSSGLAVGQMIIVGVVFTVLASSTVAVPVVGYLLASARLAEPLGRLRSWLVQYNALIMSVLLLVIGVSVIGKGLGDF